MPLNSASNSTLALEHPPMQLQIGRRLVREADADCGRQCGPSSAAHRRNSTPIAKLRALARGVRKFRYDLLAQDHRLARVLDVDRERLVEQVPILGQDLQRIAQRALMREQQAHDAEIGELARLRHAQTEGAAARHAR